MLNPLEDANVNAKTFMYVHSCANKCIVYILHKATGQNSSDTRFIIGRVIVVVTGECFGDTSSNTS